MWEGSYKHNDCGVLRGETDAHPQRESYVMDVAHVILGSDGPLKGPLGLMSHMFLRVDAFFKTPVLCRRTLPRYGAAAGLGAGGGLTNHKKANETRVSFSRPWSGIKFILYMLFGCPTVSPIFFMLCLPKSAFGTLQSEDELELPD